MAILGVDDFKSKLVGGGARANMFKVTCNFPSYAQGDVELTSFLCKGAQMPSSIIAPIMVPFRGRQLQIAGDRTFAEWTTTVMIEEDFSQRAVLEEWARKVNDGPSNIRSYGSPEDYKEDATIKLYGKTGSKLREYTLVGCWPSDVGTIELDWNTTDTIGTYTVTWSFDYFNPGS